MVPTVSARLNTRNSEEQDHVKSMIKFVMKVESRVEVVRGEG